MMKPQYAEYIVVAIKDNGAIEWFVLDKDICFLDYTQLEKAYRDKGFEFVTDDSLRFGIKIVDETTKAHFLECIRDCRVNTNELRKSLLSEKSHDDRLAYNPALLIDFDCKKLSSFFPEPESFEDFVPTGWDGEYRDFESDIPLNLRYWVDKNGKNLIQGE